ncbi:TPA: hypothetical protein JZG06_004759 [Escherichia coli]|nr:hypothetical protein [Escherichia coli]
MFDFWFKGRSRIGLTGKRQAAAVVKIMFNGNLFLLICATGEGLSNLFLGKIL